MATTHDNPSQNGKPLRVAIVGAGVIGLTCAYEMILAGAEVTIYERTSQFGRLASRRSGGMLGLGYELAGEADDDLFAFAQQSLSAWPEFTAKLEAHADASVGYSGAGTLMPIAGDLDREWLARLRAACSSRGVEWKDLDRATFTAREPAMGEQATECAFLPGDGQVDPLALLNALAKAVRALGGTMRMEAEIPSIQIHSDSSFSIQDEDWDRVLLACGSGPSAPEFIDGSDRKLGGEQNRLRGVIPVKGQMLSVTQYNGAPTHVIRSRDTYIIPKSDRILIGATSEAGLDDECVQDDVIEALWQRALGFVPSLEKSSKIESWAGVRPGTKDGRPIIGAHEINGVFVASGHYRNGILLAPATAQRIVSLVFGQVSEDSIRAFEPRRFDNYVDGQQVR